MHIINIQLILLFSRWRICWWSVVSYCHFIVDNCCNLIAWILAVNCIDRCLGSPTNSVFRWVHFIAVTFIILRIFIFLQLKKFKYF